ncbi:hypothetical protein HWI79_646 [Cryptosporidium felis]|nr:hypothetical protein HWI79_646 [Cryptosporidium felis]
MFGGIVHAKGGKERANHHLDYLENGNSNSPRRPPPARGKVVVGVHYGVHEVINSTEKDPNGLAGNVCIPGVKEHCKVVKPVEKGE